MTWFDRFEGIDWSRYIDRDLLLALMALLGIGIVMLASASLWVADRQYGNAFYYLKLLPIVLLLLGLVLIPGIGTEVKGARRWLSLGPFSIQVSEVVKLIMVLYLAGYLVRHGKKLSTSPSYQPLLIPLLGVWPCCFWAVCR